jgi:cyclic beta-1,2-glucan synthetase
VGNRLHINPCIPKNWPGYRLTYRDGAASYEIFVENPDGVNQGIRQVSLDGKILQGGEILLARDRGHHKVNILMG